MDINFDTIKHLANLSYLDINPDELSTIKKSLDSMIAMMDVLKNINPNQLTSKNIPLTNIENIVDDPKIEHLNTNSVFNNSINNDQHFFKVPKIISK
ncbi:MAG: Asp-tRNA(Asn)/Glu-tRNA(Gln) amidotransferase subunit GatC [Alphaproteobacteria bacterium]|nr:Asp-tRNA(Asn)/Glu-tRNA(Gln) amidotransferase subunit GatC [Alphaproteobacteria bacterium]